MSLGTGAGWDERYAEPGFQFGESPNEYLRAQGWRLRPGMRALAAGDGEGRNGVWLAEQGLDVLSLDWSPMGLAKACLLATARGVALRTEAADISAWEAPEGAFDLVAWIYLHLPPADRQAAAPRVLRAMAPGGLLVLECFTPAQQGRRSGGPKDPALLWSRALVERHFAGLELVELLEGSVLLDEGPRHQGPAEVVRALLRKPG